MQHMTAQEMRKSEALCVEEHAPGCTAACPLHVEMREIIRLLRAGEAEQAVKLFAEKAPFPHLVAKLCDAPCEQACTRRRVDASINIGALERRLLQELTGFSRPIKPYSNLKERVAVVGAGLSGLAAAHFLVQKGYQVTIFEQQAQIGAQFLAQNGLTQVELEADLQPLLQLAKQQTATQVGRDVSWPSLLAEYQALFVSAELPQDFAATDLDAATFQVGESKLFAAGRKLTGHLSPVRALSDGRRAGISISRYLEKVSLTAARVHEGAYESSLYVDLPQELAVQARLDEQGGVLTAEQARQEAARCLDCHCLRCVRACKFLEKFEKFPRLYIREIANTITLVGSGNRSGKNLLVACSMCGLCQELCPNAVRMPEVVSSGRREMVAKQEFSPAIYDFPVRDMLFSNGEAYSLCRHAPGETESDYLFFPGCQLAACDADYIIPAYAKLREIHPRTGIFLGCCGAPADWSGREELYDETMAALKAQIATLGSPTLLTACPTCAQQLAAAGVKTEPMWPVLAQAGLARKQEFGRVAVHDSCTARHDARLQESVRQLIRASGVEIEELAYSREKTKCCGYGGLVFYGDNEVAGQMIAARAAESELPYVAYCSVCRDYLAKTGKPALHLLDVLFSEDLQAAAARPPVSLSAKEYNRSRVHDAVLRELYGETPQAQARPPFELSAAVRALIDERLITERNLLETIRTAEAENRLLLRPGDGHLFASARPGIITYWVEYEKLAEGYRIHNAYSHRIEIKPGSKEVRA